MRTTLFSRRTLAQISGLGLLMAFYGPHPLADACSIAAPTTVTGMLGLDESREPPPDVILPANAASFSSSLGGESFMSGAVSLTRIPVGTTSYETSLGTVPVSDTADTEPPRIEEVEAVVRTRSTGCSGCAYGGSNLTTLTLSVRATDDFAAFEQLSFAVYLGETESEAYSAAGVAPDHWLLADGEGELWTLLANDDNSQFVVIRAFDQAGNASAATAALPITR